MNLQINGEDRNFEGLVSPFTLARLIESLGMKGDRVAVELNRNIVSRDRWAETTLNDGDRLEIVHFVGGGAGRFFAPHLQPVIIRETHMPPKIEVHSSAIDQLGVFAGKMFQSGKGILEIDDSRIVDSSHPLSPGDDPRHCDYLEAGKVILMAFPERHINHSCDPNSYVRTVNGGRRVIARRDIAAAEEVTYDYCINSSGDTLWQCRCGAARCRHLIHSDFFHLPLGLQCEYLPLLDAWFRQEREAEVSVLEKDRAFPQNRVTIRRNSNS